MTRLKFVLLTMLTVGAFAVLTAGASAATLESALNLPGTEVEISGLGEAEGEPIAQFNSSFATLKAKYILITFKCGVPFTLCKEDILFKKVGLGTATCSTSGDATGEELFPNAEMHMVKVPSLGRFILHLFPKTTVSCTNGIKFTYEGSILTKLNTTGESSSFETEQLCESAGSRKPKWKTYETDTGTATASLKANAGLGNEEVCVEVKAPLKTALSEMLEIM